MARRENLKATAKDNVQIYTPQRHDGDHIDEELQDITVNHYLPIRVN